MMQSQPGRESGTSTDDMPLPPAESLALIERETTCARRSLEPSPQPFLLVWGITHLVGFAGFYLASPGGPELVSMAVAGTTLGVLIVASIIFSAVYGARSGRGVRGRSQRTGALYGISWPAAFIALTVANVGMTRSFGLTDIETVLLWSCTAMVLIGGMYMITGALFRSTVMYVFGGIVLLGAVACVFVGAPASYLVVGVAVGGGMLAIAAGLAISSRRQA